jgi:hypothetical protein
VFINYFRHPESESATNLAVGRVLLSVYGIWKLLSYDFHRLQEWPTFLFETHRHGAFLLFSTHQAWLPLELWLAIGALVLFAIGYRSAISGLLAVALIVHLGALHYVVTNAGSTLLPLVYGLVLYTWVGSEDDISLDALRALRRQPPATLRARLTETTPVTFDSWPLRWLLLVLALTYFFTGYSKLVNVGVMWADGTNLALMIHREALMHLDGIPWAGRLIMDHRLLSVGSSVATLVLECGFLVAVIARLSITPFILGLSAMHVMIYLTMEILFFDQFIMYALFLPWDRIRSHFASSASVEIVCDPADSERMARLVLMGRLDVRSRSKTVVTLLSPPV